MTEDELTTPVAAPAHASRIRQMVTAALMAALLAASAWIAIPIGAVPVTLQVFVVLLAGLLLSPGWAAASVGVYVLMGAIGVPVFSGAQGGLGILVGPTGGYIVGFLLAAPTVSLLRRTLLPRRENRAAANTIAAFGGITIIYLVGWLQLAVVTGMGLSAAFVAGVLPFIAIDVAKAIVAVGVASALRRTGIAFD